MNYLKALKLVEKGKIVRCNKTNYLYKKKGSGIVSKTEDAKNWSVSLVFLDTFIKYEYEEYNELQIPIDTPMDAPVLVSNDDDELRKKCRK